MRVLLVEDDASTAKAIELSLASEPEERWPKKPAASCSSSRIDHAAQAIVFRVVGFLAADEDFLRSHGNAHRLIDRHISPGKRVKRTAIFCVNRDAVLVYVRDFAFEGIDRADKIRHKETVRLAIQPLGCLDLLDPPMIDHRNPV